MHSSRILVELENLKINSWIRFHARFWQFLVNVTFSPVSSQEQISFCPASRSMSLCAMDASVILIDPSILEDRWWRNTTFAGNRLLYAGTVYQPHKFHSLITLMVDNWREHSCPNSLSFWELTSAEIIASPRRVWPLNNHDNCHKTSRAKSARHLDAHWPCVYASCWWPYPYIDSWLSWWLTIGAKNRPCERCLRTIILLVLVRPSGSCRWGFIPDPCVCLVTLETKSG